MEGLLLTLTVILGIVVLVEFFHVGWLVSRIQEQQLIANKLLERIANAIGAQTQPKMEFRQVPEGLETQVRPQPEKSKWQQWILVGIGLVVFVLVLVWATWWR